MSDFVEAWIYEHLCLCWQTNRAMRPFFEEILKIILANSTSPRYKVQLDWDMKDSNKELYPIIGCNNLLHSIAKLNCAQHDNEVYICNLCLKQGNGAIYHCSSCGDFNLHLECATISLSMSFYILSHYIMLCPRSMKYGDEMVCNVCQLEVLEGTYYTFINVQHVIFMYTIIEQSMQGQFQITFMRSMSLY